MSNIAVVNFGSGEISPELDARKDIEKYTSGCRVLENMIPDVYGNATRRPGTEKITIGNGSGCYFEDLPSDPAKIGISTAEDLAKIGNDGAFPMDGDYELRADIDLDGIVFWPIGRLASNPGVETQFTGTFDGRNYTIRNLSYTDAKNFNDLGFNPQTKWVNYGLFFVINSTATVSNLIIENMIIENAWQVSAILTSTGLLAGSIGGTITNVHTQGSITLTASGNPTTGMSEYGGMCGNGSGGTFTHCSTDIVFNFGTALIPHDGGLSEVGGYAGTGGGSAGFTDCYAVGSITQTGDGTMKETGGFCGDASSVTGALDWTNCYAAITMTGEPNALRPSVGGMIGFFNSFFGTTFTFSDCFWDGDLVNGVENITVFDIGHVGTVAETGYIGTDVAGVTEGTSGDGGSIDMFKQATFTNWDFDTVWKITEGVDYPTFQWLSTAQNCKRL